MGAYTHIHNSLDFLILLRHLLLLYGVITLWKTEELVTIGETQKST